MATDALPDFDALRDWNDPAGTEAKLRAVLERAGAFSREGGAGKRVSSSPAGRGYLAALLSQLARAEGLQGRFGDAHRTLDEAEAALDPGSSVARARCALERGRVWNGIPGRPTAERDVARARACFLEAWDAARAAGAEADAHALDAAHMLAIVEPPDAALAWSERAIALAEASADPRARRWLGPLYNNTGWTYHDRGDFELALALFEKGVAFRAAAGQAPELRVAKWTVGRALRSLGRAAEALAAQEALERDCAAAGAPDGFVFEEIGECLLALGRARDAAPWLARAHEALSKDEWLAKNEAPRLERLLALSRA
jgi:tetratricopeptide (TPR) repeat protein